MKLIEKLVKDYYQDRPEGFGNPTDDFIAGFRKCQDLAVKKALECRCYNLNPDWNGGCAAASHQIEIMGKFE